MNRLLVERKAILLRFKIQIKKSIFNCDITMMSRTPNNTQSMSEINRAKFHVCTSSCLKGVRAQVRSYKLTERILINKMRFTGVIAKQPHKR